MKTTNDMKQLLSDMAEHPEAYADHQIEAAIDELDREPDVEAEWRRFSAAHRRRRLRWQVAAAIVGGLIVAGGAAVALRHYERADMLSKSMPAAAPQQQATDSRPAAITTPDTASADVVQPPASDATAAAVQSIKIRGTKGPKGNPVIIVNGKLLPAGHTLNGLNIDDIEKTEVWKDSARLATLTTEYGKDVYNGVLLITLKPEALQRYAWLDDTPTQASGAEYAYIEQMPDFPGGKEQLMKFTEAHLQCPDTLLQTGIGGRVIVKFDVEKDGSLSNFKALKTRLKEPSGQLVTDSAIIAMCEQEALRVARLMPTWQPGTQMGRPVKVRCSMPVRFNERKPEIYIR